jgi:hypothetical protein
MRQIVAPRSNCPTNHFVERVLVRRAVSCILSPSGRCSSSLLGPAVHDAAPKPSPRVVFTCQGSRGTVPFVDPRLNSSGV